jgi:hypothetical protein
MLGILLRHECPPRLPLSQTPLHDGDLGQGAPVLLQHVALLLLQALQSPLAAARVALGLG